MQKLKATWDKHLSCREPQGHQCLGALLIGPVAKGSKVRVTGWRKDVHPDEGVRKVWGLRGMSVIYLDSILIRDRLFSSSLINGTLLLPSSPLGLVLSLEEHKRFVVFCVLLKAAFFLALAEGEPRALYSLTPPFTHQAFLAPALGQPLVWTH